LTGSAAGLDVSPANRDPSAATRWPQDTLLSLLSPAIRAELLTRAALREYRSGAVLFRQGEVTTSAALILDGVVKLTASSANGHKMLLDIRTRGTIVAAMEALDGGPRATTATAASPVIATIITRDSLLVMLRRHLELAMALNQEFAWQLRWAHQRRVDLAAFPVHQRVARVLSEFTERYGQRTKNGIVITVNLAQPELASLVGAAEPSLQRALAYLRREGIIDTGYRRILILDPDALADAAELDPGDAGSPGWDRGPLPISHP
jgi:CRP/FNR family cyclic AMP-dependent transcriptional regulator